MTTISIAIASSGRPTLVRCLRSLAALKPSPAVLEVVIADDSPDGGVAAIIVDAGALPFPVRVIPTAAHNVSVARNACLAAAKGDLLAFVDDDEWVASDWLQRLVAAMAEFDADCVFGPVHPKYPPGTADWIVRANPLHVDWGRRGRRVTVGRCGNTLLKLAPVRAHGLVFDVSLGRTGGEDTSFFHALGKLGAVMVVTDDAQVQEDAPPSRVNIRYFRHRAIRTGQIYARFVTGTAEPHLSSRIRFYAGALIKAGVTLGAGAALWPFDKAGALRLAMRGWMNVGKLREMLRLEPAQMI